MLRNAQTAYDQATKTTDSHRQIEAQALFKAARLLEECQKNWDSPDRRNKMRDALTRNQRLWTLFQTELTEPEHELPWKLREDLLRLGMFVDKRTLETMAKPSPDKLTALININREIGSGLAVEPQ